VKGFLVEFPPAGAGGNSTKKIWPPASASCPRPDQGSY